MMPNLPEITEIQIGDILRFDGLMVKGKDRIDNRANAWLTVDDISASGEVRLRYAKTAFGDLRAGKVVLPFDRLTALIKGGVYQVVEEVGD